MAKPRMAEPRVENHTWCCEDCDWFFGGIQLVGDPDDDGVRYCVYCARPMGLVGDDGEVASDDTP